MATDRDSSRRRRRSARRADGEDDRPTVSESYVRVPQLIVIARPEAALRSRPDGVASAAGADVSSLARVIESGVTLTPLFGSSEERILARASAVAAQTGVDVPDLSVFYRVEAPVERLDELAEQLREDENVDAAYVKPAPELARIEVEAPRPEPAPPVTPDFTGRQEYLGLAPGGIDALYAHTQSGGRGAGVRIIDIEGAWRFSHEDMLQNQGGVVGGVQINEQRWLNHGTAVVGVVGGDANAFGITGICPDANVRAISVFQDSAGMTWNPAGAIRNAADMLSPGDIILIELHYPGPRFNFQDRNDQLGYIAVEWFEDQFQAIRYATAVRRVIVVEAAGNGAENLDDPLYSTRPAGFPSSWTNPFNRANRDSGAILVGAGAPPPGTHSRDHGPDRSRLGFSNFGASVDAQGWGEEVTTTGYGSLQGGSNQDEWYTDTFNGTSSASPIVVGALACVQGFRRARGQTLLTPATARQRLRATGSPQQDAPGRPASQRIGNRPNLRQLIPSPFKRVKEKEFKQEVKDKEIKQEVKDVKDKEIKQEVKDKEIKQEVKDVKDKEIKQEVKDKEFKQEGKDKLEKLEIGEKVRDIGLKLNEIGGIGGPEASVEDRLARLEASVGQLSHFIGAELRPDLTGGALMGETDLDVGDVSGLSQQLAKDSADAKQAKDGKDVEKLSEQ